MAKKMSCPVWVLMALTIALGGPNQVAGHGRMLDPPGRSSMWRLGFPTPKNYDDNGLNCGGRSVTSFSLQIFKNKNLYFHFDLYRHSTTTSIKDVAVNVATSGVRPVRDPTTRAANTERALSVRLTNPAP